jgi:hypothetical protein
LEGGTGIEKLERYNAPAIDQLPAEMIQAAERTFSVLEGVIKCNYLQEG